MLAVFQIIKYCRTTKAKQIARMLIRVNKKCNGDLVNYITRNNLIQFANKKPIFLAIFFFAISEIALQGTGCNSAAKRYEPGYSVDSSSKKFLLFA